MIRKIKQWLLNNKAGLTIGFIFGAFIAPLLATLGLVIPLFVILRPLLIGPMDFVGILIPNVQTGAYTYYVPIYKWILTIGFNGLCYAILGGTIQNIRRQRMRSQEMKTE